MKKEKTEVTAMKYITATQQDLEQITALVQETITTIYPKYYPKEVVDFFRELHCLKNIRTDVEDGRVGVLKIDNEIVGTGCFKENHITRVYVKPSAQKQGYKTVKHERWNVANGVVLVYEIMEKRL